MRRRGVLAALAAWLVAGALLFGRGFARRAGRGPFRRVTSWRDPEGPGPWAG